VAAINADLATLVYHASAAAGTDALTVSATANGAEDPDTIAISVTAATPPTPVVSTPASVLLAAGTSGPVPAVRVTDSAAGSYTVTVSDSDGLLRTGPASGLTETGEGTTSLTLAGSLAAINTDLATLTYQAATTTGTDWLWVSASVAGGPQGLGHAVMTVAPAPVAVTGLQTGAGMTVLDGTSAIQGTLQVDGAHGVRNTGTLVWNTGSIALGSGDPTATNQSGLLENIGVGTISITGAGSVNSATSTGTGTISNSGMLLKETGTGATTIYATLVNTGIVEVTAGSLAFEKAATGVGSFEIDGVATLDFAGAVGAGSTMRFLLPEGTLEDQATGTFGATVVGFAAGATIDAAALPFGSGSSLAFAAVGTADTLTVNGGGHSAIFNLQGTYASSGFVLATDGHGGTNITYG